MIHSLANIEQWAIDLSWDIIARFSHITQDNGQELPKEFFSDWIKVAKDEAKVCLKYFESHSMLIGRLNMKAAACCYFPKDSVISGK